MICIELDMGAIYWRDYMRADGFGRERINTSWRKGTAGNKYEELGTKDATEASTGARKNYWITGLPDRGIWR